MRIVYRLTWRLAAPLVFIYFLWRSRREPAYRQDWAQRLGYVPKTLPTDAIWIHAASVGEVQAITPVLEGLLDQCPGHPIVVTTMTPGGRGRLHARFGSQVHHGYIPLDLPGAVRRFLDRLKPSMGVIVEMELWPELLSAAHNRGIPLSLVNARLSELTSRRYQRLASLFRPCLGCFDWIAAQTSEDADRLLRLGGSQASLAITGNIKFDQPLAIEQIRAGEALREQLGNSRPIWAAVSTRQGEDDLVLAAMERIRATHPEAGLILVPRHPQRFDAVAALIKQHGYALVSRSGDDSPTAATAVYLGDSMGEMLYYMAAADVVFVGGSLVALGGHNLLEPAALGKPLLAGPSRFNFAAISELLDAAGALTTVHEQQELAEAATALLAAGERRRDMGTAAYHCVQSNQGARERVIDGLCAQLGSRQA